MPKRSLPAPLGCAVFAFVLAITGCSSVLPETESVLPEPNSVDDTAPTELALTDEDVAPVEIDDMLSIGLIRPTTWDPMALEGADQGSVIVADLLYDGLTEVAGTSSTLVPALAISWSANEELTEWTFELDTSRTDSATVVNSFNAVLRTSSFARTVLLGDVTTVTAIDDDTVVFVTSGPSAGLPWLLSGVGASVVGPEGSTTGAFRVEVDAPDNMVLVAGDERVEFVWAESPSEAYGWLTVGSVDVALVDESDLESAMARYGTTHPARNVSQMVVLNARSPRLSSEPQRQAILAALDRNALAEVIGEGSYAADGVAGPSVAGFQPGTCGTACGGNAESFSAVLGNASMDTLTLGYSSGHQEPLADAVVAQLADVGVTVEASLFTPEALAQSLVAGETDLVLSGWVLPASSLDGVVPGLFSSGSLVNGSGAASLTVDVLLNEAAQTTDDIARWDILNAAQTQAIELGLVAPLGYGKSRLVTAPDGPSLVQRADGSIDLDEDR